MENQNKKAWLYLLPALLFLGVFMVYPLVDVFVYSFEEGYNFASQSYHGVGWYNYSYILHDPYFLQAIKNTFILVMITVPLSTVIALLVSLGLSSIQKLRSLFQTVYFLPYVCNTLALGLVFMILFQKTPFTDGFANTVISFFGGTPIDFIDGPYWAKMFVLCFYTVWVVLPFKILILLGGLQSINKQYYDAAKVDGTPKARVLTKITIPLLSPMLAYVIITGFIGGFKEYSSIIGIFGDKMGPAHDSGRLNTMVGFIYDALGGDFQGLASAAALILFGIILVVTMINLRVSKKKVHY